MTRDSSILKHLSANHGTSILDVVLGEYQFHSGIKIYHGTGTANHDTSFTELHESVHLHLCTVTSFGSFQRFLGGLINRPGTPDNFRRAGEIALSLSIDESWFTHEGAATFSELTYYMLKHGPDRKHQFVDTLPEDYHRALMMYLTMLWPLQIPLVWQAQLCEGIAQVALTTGILVHMRDPEAFADLDFASYFGEADDRSPDKRLAIIGAVLKLPETPSILKQQIDTVLRKSLGNHPLNKQFNTYCKLSVEDKKIINDNLRAVTIEVCSARVPFQTLTDEEVHSLERELWDSWASMLPNMAPRATERSLEPRTSSFNTQLKYTIDQLDYSPSEDSFGNNLIIPFDARTEVLQFVASSRHRLYVHISHNPTSTKIGTDSFSIPSAGAAVWIQAANQSAKSIDYMFPMDGIKSEYREDGCIILCDNEQLWALLRELDEIDHVRSVFQWPINRWRPIRFPQMLVSEKHHPLFVIPAASTSEHWTRTISEIDMLTLHWLHHCQNSSAEHLRTFLLLGRTDGTIVWGRPTSSVIMEWFKRTNPFTASISLVNELPNTYLKHWYDRLTLACHHYLMRGW